MKNTERIVPVSALRDNYIWALCEGRYCVVVDPGEAAPVRNFLAAEGLQLSAILLTHRHADHQGGVAALLADGQVPVHGPRSPDMPLVTHRHEDGASFSLEGFPARFEVLAVPGHTEEHLAYLHAGHLFCGDTLFAAGCGRLLGGTATQLHASLGRLASLPAETLIHCAHEYTLSNLAFARAVEPDNTALVSREAHCRALREQSRPTLPSRLADELATNPFLRCTEPSVRAALTQRLGRAPVDTLEAFSELRRWKDVF
ncbi:hydroxyacylglutathione hydrolase [Uliginosibacterium paludis]|uniref:Hydroxyacylglutathione hydrolase n=1 Tax=Uliginosibacterium paludis TaxID=1615952 RepID=A0ABV2CKC5_9RHOO